MGVLPRGTRRWGWRSGDGREGRADRHGPVVAARPHRRQRPRRGGHPAGRLREPALHPGRPPAGLGPDRPAAAAPPHRPGARRRRVRRGAELPFVSEQVFDQLGLEADDPARRVVKLANPLSDEEPALRTSLLPGLLAALRRNDGRGSHDLALFETGLVFQPRDAAKVAANLPVDRRPSPDDIAALNAALPEQPRHVAVVLVTPASRPAGGARAARPTGPTRSRPPGPSPARPAPTCACARGSTGRGTRAAAPS